MTKKEQLTIFDLDQSSSGAFEAGNSLTSEQSQLRVSVIIPTYNNASILPLCLEALKRQDFPQQEFEIIVVDDGSTDSTETLLKQFADDMPNLRYHHQINQGPASARNRGAKLAQGDIILFTDSDCEPEENWITEMTRPFFEGDDNVAAVKGSYKTRQESFFAKFAQVEFENRYRKMNGSKSIDFVDTYAAGFRRNVFLALNGFDTSFPVANNEDVEFSYRMAQKGCKMVFNPNAVVYHHHPDTLYKYLRLKFGRAYWRMAVYRLFPEKMKSDSYTPQSLKLQIGISFLILLSVIASFWYKSHHEIILVLLGIFLLTSIPFLITVINSKYINALMALIKRFFKRGFIRHVISSLKDFLRNSFLNSIYVWVTKQIASLLISIIVIARKALGSEFARYYLLSFKRFALWVLWGVIPFVFRITWETLCLPKVILSFGARSLSHIIEYVLRLNVTKKILLAINRTLSNRILMAPLSLIMLFLRGLVMGLGIIWGLQAQTSKRGRFTEVAALVVSDLAALFMALLSAYYLKKYLLYLLFTPEAFSLMAYVGHFPLMAMITLTVFFFSGLYRPSKGLSQINEFVLLSKSLITVAAFVIIFLYITHSPLSRLTTLLFLFNTLIFVSILREICRKLVRRFAAKQIDGNPTRILIVGTGEIAQLICGKMKSMTTFDSTILGFVCDDEEYEKVDKPINGHTIIGTYRDIRRLIDDLRIQEVFMALPMMPHEEVIELINKNSYKPGVHFHIISNLFDLISAELDIAEQNNIPIAYLKNENMELLQVLIKRLFDIVVSSLVIVLTLPFWAVIMAAIRLETDGSAIFRQERVGKKGKMFSIFKFRTMYCETSQYEYAPSTPDDCRITKVGKFLRKTSLDELPQLLNVLTGDMSCVGPRPEMPFIVSKYKDWERQRLAVKPGLTGLWQIMGRKDLPLHENIEYDFYYIKNQSLLLDLIILIKTIPIIMWNRGAY